MNGGRDLCLEVVSIMHPQFLPSLLRSLPPPQERSGWVSFKPWPKYAAARRGRHKARGPPHNRSPGPGAGIVPVPVTDSYVISKVILLSVPPTSLSTHRALLHAIGTELLTGITTYPTITTLLRQ